MEFVGFGLAVVAIGVAVALFVRASTQSKLAAEREATLQGALDTAQSEAEGTAARLVALEAELAEAVARRDQKATAKALWGLELERSHRQWVDVIVPAHAERSIESVTAGEQLTFAVNQEVERLREEVGVSIRFDGAITADIEPEAALGALRISEELLALAAKTSDEVVVSLDQDDDTETVTVTLACQGWVPEEGAPTDLTAELGAAAARLDGSLSWESGDDEAQTGVLRLPAPTRTASVD